MTPLQYGWLQVPVFAGLIIGNITLSKISGKVNIRTPVWIGIVPIVLGLAVSAGAALFMVHAWGWIIGGLSLYALGSGLVNAGLYRLTLFSSPTGKGTVAATLGLITIVVFAAGIEVAKQLYFVLGSGMFMLTGMISGATGVLLIAAFLRRIPEKNIQKS
ncbi:multidrug transporter MdfA, partial [Rahnella perminowiae]|nr:multidrug transporter MdfA [Rahnella perminowiae]